MTYMYTYIYETKIMWTKTWTDTIVQDKTKIYTKSQLNGQTLNSGVHEISLSLIKIVLTLEDT